MAEGILEYKLAEKNMGSVTVSSAGTFGLDGRPAADLAVEVMAKQGIDISDHRARHVTREMLEGADIIVGMEREHLVEANVVFEDPGGKYHLLTDYGPPELQGAEIEDPYGRSIDAFRNAYARIERCVEGLLREIIRR